MKAEKDKEELKIVNLSEELDKSKPYIDKYNKAKNFNSGRQEAYAENMAFYQGNQHLLKRYKNNTPWVVNMNTPHASIAIDNRVSSLLAKDYIGELLPLGVEDVDNVVGEESLNCFGKYEDDSVFVRNDVLKADYEILLDERNYSDVVNKVQNRADEEWWEIIF